MSFATLNAGPAISAYWWVAIEGLRKRYGTYEPSWNPADSGMNRHIESIMVEPPVVGEQRIDPLNGRAEISQHSFSLLDVDDQITDLLASANIGDKAFLTKEIGTGSISELVVDDYSDLPSSGHLYIDRETFYYSAKNSIAFLTGESTECSDTFTADAGSNAYKMIDAVRTEDNDFWSGGYIVFTSGAVSGESRRILRSTGDYPLEWPESEWADVGGVESNNCIYWDEKNPLSASCSGCDYYILYPPRRLRANGLSSSPGYWDGAVVTITDDPVNPNNIGESRIVTGWDDTDDVLTFNEPFPEPFGTGANSATFDIYKYSLVCSNRALYGSRAESHKIVDARGDYKPVEVTTRPTFIKTRRVWIYENRTGGLEADAKRRQGVLSDFSLDSNLLSYSFSVDSFQRLLEQKLLSASWNGILAYPLWGGALGPVTTAMSPDGSGGVSVIGFYPVSDDGERLGFEYLKVQCMSLDSPPERGNIRIGTELIHYKTRSYAIKKSIGDLRFSLILGAWKEDYESHEAEFIRQAWLAVVDDGVPSIDVEGFCVKSRGLFSEKCGRKAVAKWAAKGSYYGSAGDIALYNRVSIPEFMSSHDSGEDIRSVLICDNSSISDIKQIDLVTFSSGSGTPTIGTTVTGGSSGATGIVNDFDTSAGRIWLIRPDSDILRADTADGMRKEFILGESLSASGWSSTLSTITHGDGIDLPARNNPINALLALMLSGNPTAQRYNYLQPGFGLGLSEDDVDVDGIEEIRDKFFSNATVDFAISEPTSFADFAEKMLRALSLFPYETTDGKVSLGYLYTEAECTEADTGSLASINANVFGAAYAPSWNSGRTPITKVNIKYNKNPCKDEYLGMIEVNFSRSRGTAQDYGRTETIECPQLYALNNVFERVNPGDPELPDLVARLINPLWGRHTMFPAPVINCTAHYSYDSEIEIGDIVKVTHALLPNLRTGTRGLTDEYFQVVSKAPEVKRGTCVFELWQVGIQDAKYGLSAPSAVVVSYAADTPVAGKSTITVEHATYGIGEHRLSDCEHFAAGDKICCLSSALDPLSSPIEVATVFSIGTDSIVLTINLSTAPTAGCIVSLPDYDNALSTARSRYVFMADENSRLGASDNTPFRFH